MFGGKGILILMEVCNLVYSYRKKMLFKLNAQKKFRVTDGN